MSGTNPVDFVLDKIISQFWESIALVTTGNIEHLKQNMIRYQ